MSQSQLDIPFVCPLAEETRPAGDTGDKSTLGLVELLLKDPARLDQLNREPAWQGELFPRFLLIAMVSYLVYSLVMLLLLNVAPETAYPRIGPLKMPPACWCKANLLGLPLAYTVGVVLAACVCLPSFYFYSLLAGVRMTWTQIVSLVGKGMAANAIMLMGILPIYAALAMGLIVFAADPDDVRVILDLGLFLPFLAGLWGLWAIYQGIMNLVDTMPAERRCRRQCFLRRLVLSWAAVYVAVVPIMIYRLWELLA